MFIVLRACLDVITERGGWGGGIILKKEPSLHEYKCVCVSVLLEKEKKWRFFSSERKKE